MRSWADRIGRRVKLRDLHILMAVAQWGSMVKAAKDLGISTPVVSKTIADIEHTLGVALLDRHPHGIEPTLYGRALIKRSIAVFDELRQSVHDIESLADPTTGDVRIGSTEPLAAGIVPAIIERLNRRHPRISFHVVQADFATSLRELRAREIDLMVGRPPDPISETDLDSHVLFKDRRLFVVAGMQNPLARRRKVALADVIHEPWCLPPVGSIPRLAIIAAFHAAGLEPPRGTVSTAALQLQTHMLASGRFISSMPESMIHFGGKNSSIKVLVEIPAVQLSPVLLVTLKNRTPNPAAQLVIDCAREVAKPLAKRK
jgi:DNA-binding transcriptional LysR family regulator